MIEKKKQINKVQKAFRLDFMLASSLSEYSKRYKKTEIEIVEKSLYEFFKGIEDSEKLNVLASQLEILTARLERMELNINAIVEKLNKYE